MRFAAAKLRTRLIGTAVLSIVVAAVLAVAGTHDWSSGGRGGQTAASTPRKAAMTPTDAARFFLSTYVDGDGRVVRRDQGSDTVSEGQAYGMLLAVVVRDQGAFDRIWSWTRSNLARPDGLLSWTWAGGKVQDTNSASDADVDAAHALVAAGKIFGRADLSAAGVQLGRAALDHETVTTPLGRVLVAGQWATTAPQRVNPSYSSPAAYRALGAASGDPRWHELAAGDRRLLDTLLSAAALPPDWAQVEQDGTVHAMPPPGGGAVAFGLDAQRVAVRYAGSCDRDDQHIAARLAPSLPGSPADTRGVYDLGGGAQVPWQQPLSMVASAAARQANGDQPAATALLAAARDLDARGSTYYGAAWSALGPVLLGGGRALGDDCG